MSLRSTFILLQKARGDVRHSVPGTIVPTDGCMPVEIKAALRHHEDMNTTPERPDDIDWDSLPQAAGLCTLDEACSDGLSVDQCVQRLKRYHYTFHRLWNIFLSKLTAEPVYEVKMAFSYHAYLCSENVRLLRERVAEMRHPPLGLDKVPHPQLKTFLDEILASDSTHRTLVAIYELALPALRTAMENHFRDAHPLADAPGHRIARMAIMDIDQMIECGSSMIKAFHQRIERDEELQPWIGELQCWLECAGGLDGSQPETGGIPPRRFSAAPFVYRREPRRDHRFPDPYNMGVHAEQFLYEPKFSPRTKTLMMYFKRLREIDVPEMMASILVETQDREWDFYRDMTRQLWDEARHAIMGEAGFHKLKIDWPSLVRVNFTWSMGLNTQLSPRERHAVLWYIEQGLMSKTGKRYEWEVGTESGDSLSALFQDYDWADEVLHARIGRDWYVADFESVEKAAEYGSHCWSKVVSDWDQWVRDGLTTHENWWPELYREFCRIHNLTPDPDELAFNTSYRDTRADLRRIAASG